MRLSGIIGRIRTSYPFLVLVYTGVILGIIFIFLLLVVNKVTFIYNQF
jgi:hypothetical protein